MNEKKRVKVFWTSRDAGGRDVPFDGTRYSTLARFPEDADSWRRVGWSVVVDFESTPREPGKVALGWAYFLSDEAPIERLYPGQVFELYEGTRNTAIVEVLG